jgi:hypothetical protein
MQQQKLHKKCFRRDATSPSESSSSSSSSSLSVSSPSSLTEDPLPEDPFDDPDLDGASRERVEAGNGRSIDRTEQRLCSDLDCDM